MVGATLSKNLCAQQHLHFIGDRLVDDVCSGNIEAPELRHVPFEAESVKQVLSHLVNRTCEVRPVIKVK